MLGSRGIINTYLGFRKRSLLNAERGFLDDKFDKLGE